MSVVSIVDSIPHRAPMLLVDEVASCSDDEITCFKSFCPDEFFFQGHYPGHPLVPGVILCECAAQSAAILLANRSEVTQAANEKVPVLTRMNQVRFKHTVHPGEQIEIQVQLKETVGGAWFLQAKIRKEGKLAASLELACTLADKSATEESNPVSDPASSESSNAS